MEFGALIPLFFITVCLLCSTSIGGAILLLVLFLRKDKRLAWTLLITLAVVALTWYLVPIISLGVSALQTCVYAPQCSSMYTWELMAGTLVDSLYTFFFSIPCGTVIACGMVLPISLLVSAIRKREAVSESPE